MPGHATDLNDFVTDVLEDIWSRISHEFSSNPAKDMVMWHEREPEFTLQKSLPFYFSRSVQEHTVVRCIKLGRPKIIFVAGLEVSDSPDIVPVESASCSSVII